MITAKERLTSRQVFDAVRATVQGIHPEAVFGEDSCGSPFLFRSMDAKVWVRVFYQSLDAAASEELREELEKLSVLMPKDALMYLFYPSLDQGQMSKFRSGGDRLAFFEYGGLLEDQTEKAGIQIRKWVPASASPREAIVIKAPLAKNGQPALFLNYARLSMDEIGGLVELGLSLKRA